jgi:hypothetical protein
MANGGYFMHRSSILSALILILVLFAAGADAQKARFAGTFINEDPDTRGLTRLTLLDNDIVNVWGKCNPTDCNWGEESIVAYAPGVESDVQSSSQGIIGHLCTSARGKRFNNQTTEGRSSAGRCFYPLYRPQRPFGVHNELCAGTRSRTSLLMVSDQMRRMAQAPAETRTNLFWCNSLAA